MPKLTKRRHRGDPPLSLAGRRLLHRRHAGMDRCGLVPIEQMKIGDSVLSQPEGTGERAYRKVVRTFSYEGKSVMSVRYGVVGDDTISYDQYATGNHPFWVKGTGWTRADLLEDGAELELQDGRQAFVLEVAQVYKTNRPNVGWEPEYSHSVVGFEADHSKGWD
ncbi:polymorphic toxin-type HINT domain-containing protein [Xanthomonas oryzae]|uniref:polymorphic toxin-type HINT domain-containing protein n=2 Tax=Xanthomonas oryzae TaxID=347 RepID=UPI0009E9326F|nr:polymorphic toxin-type HINT domain-containing protein [Xanthomonas oryzae]QBG92134.1 hypothetical protein EYR26_11750 [Xanthomonas oryzae]UNE61067.1 HINT domain-containing protein [Xanthomonas oryzae]